MRQRVCRLPAGPNTFQHTGATGNIPGLVAMACLDMLRVFKLAAYALHMPA